MAMEIVLQWLDEIDDLVAAGLFKPKFLRAVCLVAALAAAIASPVLVRLGVGSGAVLALLNLSLALLIAWAFVGSVSAGLARRGRSHSRNA